MGGVEGGVNPPELLPARAAKAKGSKTACAHGRPWGDGGDAGGEAAAAGARSAESGLELLEERRRVSGVC